MFNLIKKDNRLGDDLKSEVANPNFCDKLEVKISNLGYPFGGSKYDPDI